MHLLGARIGLPAGTGFAFAAALASAGGCGDGVAEPIVAVAAEPAPAVTSDAAVPDPGGLCSFCSGNRTCGDENDTCLFNLTTEERFCGRDCDESGGCPQGYACQRVINGARQCQPPALGCLSRVQPEGPPSLAAVRSHVLADFNQWRAELGLPPMVGDACLDGLAQASAGELALRDEQDFEFQDACGWAFETRCKVATWELDWRRAVTAPWREPSITAGSRGLPDTLRSTSWTRLGLGIFMGGDEAWIALTYGK
jgi:hypothetical protein